MRRERGGSGDDEGRFDVALLSIDASSIERLLSLQEITEPLQMAIIHNANVVRALEWILAFVQHKEIT